MEKLSITLRIDVDYPYPSRFRSFLYTVLGIRTSREYLRNSKIVARMINESPQKAKAYWFFTPKTIPDQELLTLLDNERHEIALHIVNNPYAEMENLEKTTGKKARYYTIHGTARIFARLMWRKWKSWDPKIPTEFPLQSFHQFPTKGLDSLCFTTSPSQALKIAEECIRKGCVVYFHPIWLFQRGKMNHRGPFYEAFRGILAVDSELESLAINKKLSIKVARDLREYERNVIPTKDLIEKLGERGTDIFTFLERKWCFTIPRPQRNWAKSADNVALLRLESYDDWWKGVGKKTRNMIRKAEKNGIRTEIAEPNGKLAGSMWRIYNETPIRQERAFPHYGISLETVKKSLLSTLNSTYIGAYLQDELVGFVQLVHGDNVSIISQILSLQKHWDKAVNNALVAKAIEVCASRHEGWIMYGRMGNHPTLDNFKQNNGFTQFSLNRYYMPLTRKGKIAIRLGLHREIKDAIPQALKRPLFPLYNWVSRTKAKIRLGPEPETDNLT